MLGRAGPTVASLSGPREPGRISPPNRCEGLDVAEVPAGIPECGRYPNCREGSGHDEGCLYRSVTAGWQRSPGGPSCEHGASVAWHGEARNPRVAPIPDDIGLVLWPPALRAADQGREMLSFIEGETVCARDPRSLHVRRRSPAGCPASHHTSERVSRPEHEVL